MQLPLTGQLRELIRERNHGSCVPLAVSEQRLPQLLSFFRMNSGSAQYDPRQLDAGSLGLGDGEIVVAESGHESGKNLLDAEAAAEFFVVDVLAHDRLQVDEIVGDSLEQCRFVRARVGDQLDAASLELSVVGGDRSRRPAK